MFLISDALEEHDGKVICSIGGRNIIYMRFANEIDDLAEEEQGIRWRSVLIRPN